MKVVVGASTLTFVMVLELALQSATGTRWLSIASAGSVDQIRIEDECDKLVGLVKKQKQICRKNVEMMEAVKSGAAVAIQECQQQFANRRWNCSTINAVSIFGKIHNSGIREMAFVHAISSAGVAHAVTRACSSGQLDRCGCDKTVAQRTTGGGGGGFEWDGCSDNAAYGSAFAKLFVDAREKARGKEASRALMNLHNNNAGRKAIEDNMKVQCKCHGVSGSCELKTCWRSVPSFRDVGNLLKDKYNGATEVEQKLVGGTRRELIPKNDQFKPPTDVDLVYLSSSPDFCEPDRRTGSLGTHGRICDRNSRAIDGCELLCCGRGFNVRRRRIVERCNCKFNWCCTVKCQKCRRVVEEFVCR